MYSRRTVIASGLALFGAGCQSFNFDGHDPNQFCKYELRARPFDPTEELPPDYSPFQRRVAIKAIHQEQVTAVYGPRPLKNDSYVVDEGEYYRVYHVNDGMRELPVLIMSIEWIPGQTAPSDARVFSAADLPNVDRLALRSAVYGGLYREQVHPQQKLDYSKSPVLYPNGTESSLLASYETCWVRWNSRLYQITVHGERTIEKLVYEYAAEEVAPNATAFRQKIADQYLVNLDSLPPEEQAILEEAIKERYFRRTQSQIPEAERLLERLRNETSTVPESGGQWYIEYEKARYGLKYGRACQGI